MASLTELNNEANALKQAGRIDEAIAAFRAIVDTAPGNAVVMHNYAAALGDAGRNNEAAEWARKAIAAGIKAPETRLVLARAHVALGEIDAAAAAFAEAVSMRPVDPVAQRENAQLIWMATGDRDKMLAAVNNAIAANPGNVDLRIVRANAVGNSGDKKGEYAEMLEVLRLAGAAPMIECVTADAALEAGEYHKALEHASAAAAALGPERQALAALCRAFLAVGEPDGALAPVSRLRAEFPLDQSYIALQATAWRMLGDDRYHTLFDYKRFVRRFPLACPKGWKSVEAYVDDLIETLDRRHQYVTHPFGQSVRHGSQLPSINQIDDPVLKAVGEAVHGPISNYISLLGEGPDPLRLRNRGSYRLFSIWSIRLKASGYHINHVHSQGWLSSACHLRLPAAKDENDRSGWLTFGEPGIATTPPLEPEYFVRPEIGVMAVFPSYMWHGTVPFSAETTRLTIAGDSVPASI